MKTRASLAVQCIFFIGFIASSRGQIDFGGWFENETIPGPDGTVNRQDWVANLTLWRQQVLDSIGWDGQGVYNISSMEWTQASYA